MISDAIKLNIYAAYLHSMVMDAPLDECRETLGKMAMPQAIQYLKEKYLKIALRKQNIEYMQENFPEKKVEDIIKALDKSNDDIDAAFQFLLENPESYEANEAAGIISNISEYIVNDQSSDYDEDGDKNKDGDESEDENEEGKFDYFAFKKIDLHGYTKEEAKITVESELMHAKANKIAVFHFITGVGNHSVNNIPILRPVVLEICKKFNFHTFLPRKNKGTVVCDIRKPYEEIDENS